MKLAPKLLLPLALFALVLAGVIANVRYNQNRVGEAHARAAAAHEQALQAAEIRSLSRAIQRDTLKILDEPSGPVADRLRASVRARGADMMRRAEALAAASGAEIGAPLVNLQRAVVSALAGADQAAVQKGSEAGQRFFKDVVEPAEKKASQIVESLVASTEAAADELGRAAEEIQSRALQIILWTSLATAIAAFGIATHVVLAKVVRPLGQLRDAIGALSRQQYAAAIPCCERSDELGEIAQAVESFRDKLVEAQRLGAEQEELREAARREREANEAQRARAMAEVEQVVKSLRMTLDDLSKQDLTTRVVASFAPEYAQIRFDFNQAVGALENAIRVVAGHGATIEVNSGEISQALDDLSRRTEQQASNLEETAAALHQITVAMRQSATGAQEARQMTEAARLDAETPGATVREAVAAMGTIEKSAGEITNIIGVIDEIAFQTNLLALNAGVEAARAGEAGKGFAIVAAEVRTLAQRSAEAASQVKKIVSDSTGAVGHGAGLVRDTGEALLRIVHQVSSINEIVAAIAASAQEQAAGLEQVNTAVAQMDQITQRNAAMVEQSTAASKGLAMEAAALAQLLGEFRVRDGVRLAA